MKYEINQDCVVRDDNEDCEPYCIECGCNEQDGTFLYNRTIAIVKCIN